MIKFGIIGAGWRSEFYLRIANLVPEKFSVCGIYIRNPEKRKEFSKKYSVKIFDNLNDLLATEFDFIVSCVNKDSVSATAEMLSQKDIYVLTETPITDKISGEKVQVAEQFHLMPRNQAYKTIIGSGILGQVHQVQLSCCHDYHAASLIRFFLDIKNEKPIKTTVCLPDNLNRYNCRNGYITPVNVDSNQQITILDFGSKSAVYNFNFEQYFSDIRSSMIIIRGSNGEIINNTCTYLKNGIPISFELKRSEFGNEESLNGFSLFSITGNGKVLYTNPFINARLSDEEIAIATCLIKMNDFVKNKKEFYSPNDAIIDYQLMH